MLPEGYTVPASLSLSEVVDTSKHRKQTICGCLFICRIKQMKKMILLSPFEKNNVFHSTTNKNCTHYFLSLLLYRCSSDDTASGFSGIILVLKD